MNEAVCETTYRREDGSRIKIFCDARFNIEVHKAVKGKRFNKVAPLRFSDTTEYGHRFNGAFLYDKNNKSVLWDGKAVDGETYRLYTTLMYVTLDEIDAIKLLAWEAIKPCPMSKIYSQPPKQY